MKIKVYEWFNIMSEKRKKIYFETKRSINKINILRIIFNFGITLFFANIVNQKTIRLYVIKNITKKCVFSHFILINFFFLKKKQIFCLYRKSNNNSFIYDKKYNEKVRIFLILF